MSVCISHGPEQTKGADRDVVETAENAVKTPDRYPPASSRLCSNRKSPQEDVLRAKHEEIVLSEYAKSHDASRELSSSKRSRVGNSTSSQNTNLLTEFARTPPDRYSSRDTRHFDYISQFITDVLNIKGTDSVIPSRAEHTTVSATADNDRKADGRSEE
ncbi:unnamed protein product [Protopolystoma xenopodis]|uniref:Uncharacterized protein n=1 Tax=Protopolystoma xenopodis TaxID=117903 RepID=A0A448WWD5_9PLAT|nr:unnamed protein product [Protopolystoma xenopodis]